MSEKKLSEAFERDGDDNTSPSLELVVKVYNINTGIGDDLLQKCDVLQQYTKLIDLVRYAKTHEEELGLEERLHGRYKRLESKRFCRSV